MHYAEDYCTEEHCTEEDCIEETDAPEVELLVMEMAYGLIQGVMSPEDIYEGMVEANYGNKDVARIIRDRAVAEAQQYNRVCGEN